MSIKRTTLLILLFGALPLAAWLFFMPIIKERNFQNLLSRISESEVLNKAILSVEAKYENEDDYLVQYNSLTPINLGSNFKLFTAAAALELLGPNFTFKTDLRLTDHGDLILVGGGDPTLEVQDFNDFSDALKELNWKGGKLFYNDQFFSGEKYGPNWNSAWLDKSFAVPISALQIHNNIINVFGVIDQQSEKFEITTLPLENYFKVIDQRKVVAKVQDVKNSTSAIWDNAKEVITLNGETTADLPFAISATVSDPSLYTAKIFAQELRKNGIQVTAIEKFSGENDDGKLIFEHSSSPLEEIIARMLKFSMNNYAETLIRTLGETKSMEGTEGSQKKGVLILTEFAKSLGISSGQFLAFDGSGLSYDTRVSADAIITLFEYTNKQTWKNVFWNSLSDAGNNGTLKSRFKDLDEDTILLGKTGTHVGATSLSGKIVRENGKNILFSIHIYGHKFTTQEASANIVPLIDKVVVLLEQQF